jgi:hypothetical protein
MVVWRRVSLSPGSSRAFLVWSNARSFSPSGWQALPPFNKRLGVLLAAALVGLSGVADAQTISMRRGLWSRVGATAPDMFEPGRTSAVGIFLGTRAGPGYSVNIVSAIRRRDRIMLVFEEIAPAEVMMAERMPSSPRPVAGANNMSSGPNVGAAFAPPGVSGLAPPPPPLARPLGSPTSPWAIVLINRVDLPITVEQRLFR